MQSMRVSPTGVAPIFCAPFRSFGRWVSFRPWMSRVGTGFHGSLLNSDEDTGATRYRTTALFLERLGLRTLEELPSLAPLLPELDEVAFDSSST